MEPPKILSLKMAPPSASPTTTTTTNKQTNKQTKTEGMYRQANLFCQVISNYGKNSMEKLAGDLLGLKFVRLEILSVNIIHIFSS